MLIWRICKNTEATWKKQKKTEHNCPYLCHITGPWVWLCPGPSHWVKLCRPGPVGEWEPAGIKTGSHQKVKKWGTKLNVWWKILVLNNLYHPVWGSNLQPRDQASDAPSTEPAGDAPLGFLLRVGTEPWGSWWPGLQNDNGLNNWIFIDSVPNKIWQVISFQSAVSDLVGWVALTVDRREVCTQSFSSRVKTSLPTPPPRPLPPLV